MMQGNQGFFQKSLKALETLKNIFSSYNIEIWLLKDELYFVYKMRYSVKIEKIKIIMPVS